ncbi:MAG: hypothetical protein IIA44_10220, partial [Acidobacteria bacterium]|nr:hypothetical protein [Acidobacteriota bacterium]
MTDLSKNVGLQQTQDSAHRIDCAKQGHAEWEIRGSLIPSYPSYYDKYLNGSGELHIHFGWVDNRAIGSQATGRRFPSNYCAVLSKVGRPRSDEDGLDIRTMAANNESGNKILHTAADNNKLTVLIRVIEAANDTERISVGVRPQLIRLRRYDACLGVRM